MSWMMLLETENVTQKEEPGSNDVIISWPLTSDRKHVHYFCQDSLLDWLVEKWKETV